MRIFRQLQREELANIDEILSFFLGIVFIFFFVIPVCTEFLVTYLQGQEVEHLTGMAANRACSLLPNNLENEDGTIKSRQGSMGPLLKAEQVRDLMEKVVDETFIEHAKNLSSYNESWQVRVYDIYGCNITDGAHECGEESAEDAENPGYPEGFIGASPSRYMCPASPEEDLPANWCLEDTEGRKKMKQGFKAGNLGDIEQSRQDSEGVPSSLRHEFFQGGRTMPGTSARMNFQNILKGVIYKCVVTAEKDRLSIFKYAGIGRLDTKHESIFDDFLPSVIRKQAEATFRHENSAPLEFNAYNRGTKLLPNYKNYEMADVAGSTGCGENNTNCAAGEDLTLISEQEPGSTGDKIDRHESVKIDFFEGDANLKEGFELLDSPVKDIPL